MYRASGKTNLTHAVTLRLVAAKPVLQAQASEPALLPYAVDAEAQLREPRAHSFA
jgi:hypothetical protein